MAPGCRLQEGELALTGSLFPGVTAAVADLTQSNGAAECLLGRLRTKTHRAAQAAASYRASISENPFMWFAFEALCRAGEEVNVDEVFAAREPPPTHAERTAEESNLQGSTGNAVNVLFATPDPISGAGLLRTPMRPQDMQPLMATPQTPGSAGMQTPGVGMFSLAGSTSSVPTMSALGTPPPQSFITPSPLPAGAGAPNVRVRAPVLADHLAPRKVGTRLTFQDTMTPDPTVGPRPAAPVAPTPTRRSARLFSGTLKRKGKDPKKPEGGPKGLKRPLPAAALPTAAVAAVGKKSLAKNSSGGHHPPMQPGEPSAASSAAALGLLKEFARGVQALAQYRCHEAIAAFSSLPAPHFSSGWAQCQIGRAHFELTNYKAADSAFRMARRLEPHRLAGMEIYSTVLWHMRQETPLSYLGHEVVAADRNSPEAWCVVGNCFSLQKEHDSAVKFFERAIQVDPTFAYAYTLLGHEYVYNEDFTKALACFRNALRYDPRHYNAWYVGLCGLPVPWMLLCRFCEDVRWF